MSEKLDIIKYNISDSAKKSGRRAEDILLLPVTKTRTPEEIMPALECGVRAIGENYVQELVAKYDVLAPYVDEFHMIGHLQSNKVKYIADKVSLIHSVDSLSLMKEIDKQAKKHEKVQDVLLEVNLTKEASKSGIYEENLERLFWESKNFSNLLVKGFMTMPPAGSSEDTLRRIFSRLYQLFCKFALEDASVEILSMGMSHDYQIAIEEGATLVRVGSAIFGPRDYTKISNRDTGI
ncbi:MAG: YggS family pyridoxal phosphate-dependent enzyme [Clostridia bacterium]|nr:YggS family pyridoxal phosphate-dependent enzyme [Clostridia bacterium]